MYSKFNCTISNFYYGQNINKHYDAGKKIYEQFEQQSQYCLKNFLLDNGHIDASTLKNHWFKIKKADIFISHSHNDIKKVMAFAGWLKEQFGLTAFIDSCAWGYCNDLLKLIDDKYCKHIDGRTYDYQLRNYTTSHVHAMLSSALLEMIDSTECLIFYNTPNSIYLDCELKNVKNRQITLSPWIYCELSTANTILTREPKRRINVRESVEDISSRIFSDVSAPPFEYDVSSVLQNMCTLDDNLLERWRSAYYGNKSHALDVLYKLVAHK